MSKNKCLFKLNAFSFSFSSFSFERVKNRVFFAMVPPPRHRLTNDEKKDELRAKLERRYQRQRKREEDSKTNYTKEIIEREQRNNEFLSIGNNKKTNEKEKIAKTREDKKKTDVDLPKNNPYFKERAKYLEMKKQREEEMEKARKDREAKTKKLKKRRAKQNHLTYKKTRNGQRDMGALITRALERSEVINKRE